MVKLLTILLLVSQVSFGQIIGFEVKPHLNQRLGTGSAFFLAGTRTFDSSAVLEMTPLRAGDSLRFYYSGANMSNLTSVGVVTVTDMGATQVKFGAVVGNGKVVARYANCSEIVRQGDSVYLFAVDYYNFLGTQHCYLYASADGFNFYDRGIVMNKSLIPSGTGYGNIGFVKDTAENIVQIDGYYYQVTEANESSLWQLYILRSTNLKSGWEFVRKASGLQIGTGSYSGACVKYIDGVFHIFYHYSSTGVIPTYLAYATSTDLTTFSVKEKPFKALESTYYGPLAPPTYETGTSQIADCYLFQWKGQTHLIAEYFKNSNPVQGVIFKWTYPGTIKQLTTGLTNCIDCPGTYP